MSGFGYRKHLKQQKMHRSQPSYTRSFKCYQLPTEVQGTGAVLGTLNNMCAGPEVGYHLGSVSTRDTGTYNTCIYIYIHSFLLTATTYNTVRRRINSGLHVFITICYVDVIFLIFIL